MQANQINKYTKSVQLRRVQRCSLRDVRSLVTPPSWYCNNHWT